MKKLSSFLVLFLFTIFASQGHAQTALPQPDSLIKGDLPTIYYYAADGYRYVFPNNKTFGSWFSDYGTVITVSTEVLGKIPLKGNVTYRPGVRMVKITTVPKVYVVDQGGKLRWVKSEELAKKLYGDDWNKKIDDVPDEFFTNYTEGPPLENETEYNPTTAVETTQTINYDRGIKETVNALRASTKVGSLTEIRELIKDLKNLKKSLPSIVPPLLVPPIFLPFYSSSTPTSTVPAIPAIPATPATSTATSTLPATPAIPAIPAIPVVPVTPTNPSTATSTSATTTPAVPIAPTVFTVTSPNGGETWTPGNAYTITWTSAGPSVGTVNVILYKSGVYITSIAYNVSNNGSFNWTVPSTISLGSDYKIRVENAVNYTNFDESNSAFNITVLVTAPSASPIGYWKFDGNGNSDIVGSPSAATVGSATFKTSGGKFGGYLYMPGSSDYAKIPYNSMFDLQNFTIEFWFRQRFNQSFQQNLVYKGTPINNYNFNIFRVLWNQYNNGAVIAGATAAGTGYWHQVSNNNEPPHNAWHHVVFTKTTEGAAYYIDGTLIHSRNYVADNSPEYAGPVKTPALDIVIGNPAPDTDIDNLRIYKYSLSRGEVLYNWQNTPDVVAVADTTPPTISLTSPATGATVSGSNVIVIAASSDNVGVKNITLKLDGAFLGSAETSDASLPSTTNLSWNTTNASNGSHTLVAVAIDAAGNTATSTAITVTVNNVTLPPTPTNVQAVTTSGSQTQPPEMWYYLVFNYNLQSTTQSFNIYRKRPTDASFVKYTYSAQMTVNPSILPLPGSNESNLYHRDPNQWSWYTTLTGLASDIAQGEYKFYVTAVDTSGVESLPSETKSFKLYAAPVITSPADGSTVSAPFTITVSGDPSASSPTYGMSLYKKITGDTAWSVWPAPSTNFTYTGQALNPSDNPHRLVVWFSSGIYDRSLFRTSVFNISTTTLATATKIQLAQRLAKQNLNLQKVTLVGENVVQTKVRFTQYLARGISGDEVRLLQEVLAQLPKIYPEGLITGYFGALTEAAVKRFQIQNNLEAVGIVGPKTRLKLNDLVGY